MLTIDLDIARRLARIARALTWERALRSSREQGEPVEERFESAVPETLLEIPPP